MLRVVVLETDEDARVDGVDGVVVGLARGPAGRAHPHGGVDVREVVLRVRAAREEHVLAAVRVPVHHLVVGDLPRIRHRAVLRVGVEVLEVVVREVDDHVDHPAPVADELGGAARDVVAQPLGDADVGEREERAVVARSVQAAPLPVKAPQQVVHAADRRAAAVRDSVRLHLRRHRHRREELRPRQVLGALGRKRRRRARRERGSHGRRGNGGVPSPHAPWASFARQYASRVAR